MSLLTYDYYFRLNLIALSLRATPSLYGFHVLHAVAYAEPDGTKLEVSLRFYLTVQ